MNIGDLIGILSAYHPSDEVVVQTVGKSDTPLQGVTGVTCYPGIAAVRAYPANNDK